MQDLAFLALGLGSFGLLLWMLAGLDERVLDRRR
jgi:hypothetical protein